MNIIRVAVFTPLRQLFDYHCEQCVSIGARVLVPFGKRQLVAIVIETNCDATFDLKKLRSIDTVLDESPIFTKPIYDLCQFASRYYQHPLGDTFSTALPAALRTAKHLEPLKAWHTNPTAPKIKPSPKQVESLEKLGSQTLSTLSLKQLGVSEATITSLHKKAQIISTKPSKPLLPDQIDTLTLNNEQQIAFETVKKQLNKSSVFLLEGITGSGKTEIYIQLCFEVLKRGKHVLILVPEINLTPQLTERFTQRFGAICLSIHSGLNQKERLLAWQQIKAGLAPIVIGTRSAIFAPLSELGLIIVDEEHDASFKQQEGLRYSARDLACIRSQKETCPVILGSATPSLESLHNALQKRFIHLRLTERPNKIALPQWHLIDMRGQYAESGLSDKLIAALRDCLARKEQALVFLNRRGFSPVLLCTQCGFSQHCPQCDMNLTYYAASQQCRCHHCDAQYAALKHCPKCQSTLTAIGFGTERIEEHLIKLFPKSTITRIDRDTTRNKNAFEEKLASAHRGESGILLGTQMLAKGHHFPKVTLVAIINIDSSLFSIDFRALEKMGQLLTQVSGRAGRTGLKSQAYLQTLNPDHPELLFLLKKGYHAFAKKLLIERKKALLPPYHALILISAQAKSLDQAMRFLEHLQSKISDKLLCLGPAPAPMMKRAGFYRAQLMLQTNNRKAAQDTLEKTLAKLNPKTTRQVNWRIDVDPQDIF